MKAKILRFARRILACFTWLPCWNSICLRGTKLSCKGAALMRCKIDCKGKNNMIFVGRNALLTKCSVYIRGDNNVIYIGEDVHVKCGEFYIEDSGNKIELGDNVSLCGHAHLACTEGTNITIGNNCLLSSEIVFRSGDSHSVIDMHGNRINPAASITIGEYVWIGHRVLINKGVTVMSHSVIGTGSILTKSFTQGNVCIAGVPAKIVRENVDWCGKRL